jgi:hypothetical protein
MVCVGNRNPHVTRVHFKQQCAVNKKSLSTKVLQVRSRSAFCDMIRMRCGDPHQSKKENALLQIRINLQANGTRAP